MVEPEVMWVRSHVRLLAADYWQQCCVAVDDDGDVPFRHGTAACWVTVLDSSPIMVRVFAHAVLGVKSSAKLLRLLGDTQRAALSVRIDYVDGLVVVAQTLSPDNLTASVLGQAIKSVGAAADDIGCLVAAMFDGFTPFDAETSVDEEAS